MTGTQMMRIERITADPFGAEECQLVGAPDECEALGKVGCPEGTELEGERG